MKTKAARLKEPSRVPTQLILRIDFSFQIYEKMNGSKIPFFQDIDWMTELKGIERYLTKLTKRGFLTQRQSRVFLGEVLDTAYESAKGQQRMVSRHFKKKRGAPEDRPFNFLIFALVSNSIRFTGKPRWKSIAALLHDRVDVVMGSDELRKRYSRLTKKAIEDTLNWFRIANPEIAEIPNPLDPPPQRQLSPNIRELMMKYPSR